MYILRAKFPHNLIGALASSLCLLHCIATPLLFAVQASMLAHEVEHPEWWGTLDVIFLIISLLAVWQSSKTTAKTWVRYALWMSWLFLSIVILNEKLSILSLPELAIYFPTIALIGLHLYNRKYCHCKDDGCCVHSKEQTR